MLAKIVRVVVLLLLIYAVGMSTFNLVSIHELSGLFGGDVGILKGESTYIRAKIESLDETVESLDTKVDTHKETVEKYHKMWVKAEKDIDKLNARVVHIEYHRQWEIRKKIAQTRAKLIREKIWKENVKQ